MNVTILNKNSERLDVLVEGNKKAETTIIFVHGFGVDKHETAGYFDDISITLQKDFRIVRFDFSGYGKSEGKQEDWDYKKGASDLQSVIDWVTEKYKNKIYILAHSMGTFVTALLSPENIEKIVLTGLPNSNTKFILERFPERFISRPGAKLDKSGISFFPRSSGLVTRIGPNFWKELEALDPIKAIDSLNKKTKLIIFRPMQDEVIGNNFMEEYESIPNINIVKLPGDHSFKIKSERKEVIRRIKDFFK